MRGASRGSITSEATRDSAGRVRLRVSDTLHWLPATPPSRRRDRVRSVASAPRAAPHDARLGLLRRLTISDARAHPPPPPPRAARARHCAPPALRPSRRAAAARLPRARPSRVAAASVTGAGLRWLRHAGLRTVGNAAPALAKAASAGGPCAVAWSHDGHCCATHQLHEVGSLVRTRRQQALSKGK